MNVKSRQQENAEATREALLESALSAFIEHGYGGVSIDAIAREARVTKGAFYHHFGSKQELLAECYERQVRTIAEDLDRVPAHVDKWAEAAALAEAFIDSVMARGKRQLSLQEVITVVGWERWKRIDSRHTLRYVGRLVDELSRRPSGLRKTKHQANSLAHRTTWLRSDFFAMHATSGKRPMK
ncbi:TetR/AcrR family transcriptional regulator [Pseudomonas aeruginosa]|uniref:TetR/AcrR family transcriptional regulator n=1 Tax=Pseudomonas aeruginosa TaxID=287 RepID=UPI00301D4717